MSELVEILVKNRHLASSEAMVAYENALNALWKAPKNSADLPRLISAFCDVEDYESMWSLLHYVESFGGGITSRRLLKPRLNYPLTVKIGGDDFTGEF